MHTEEPIEPSLQLQFQTERLKRIIVECDDTEILKAIALQLIELNQTKTAVAQWATKRAAQAETRVVNQTNDSIE